MPAKPRLRPGRFAPPGPVENVPGLYSALSMGTRLFLKARWAWTPYAKMASLMPRKGRLLDAGCGYGLFSLTLALQAPARKVEGVDHSKSRVEAAIRAGRGVSNVHFRIGDFLDIPGNSYSGMALIDVLHYLNHDSQAKLLRKTFHRLPKGGLLLFREVDRGPGPGSWLNQFYESVATKTGFTKAEGLHFRSGAQWESLAKSVGFRVQAIPSARFPFADVLYHCRKP